MPWRMLFVLFLICGLVAVSAAQQNACTLTEIAVGVADFKGEPFRGLNESDFVGHASKARVAIRSLAYDDGPRRVALVVDQYKKLSADGHQAAQDLVGALLAAGRPQDSFALVVARGPAEVVKFGEDSSRITNAVRESDARQGKELGVLDAVMEAISLFGERQHGDAIVVIAGDMEGNHRANPKTVAKALAEHGIRMFGLALGPVSKGNIAAGGQAMTAWGLATVTPGLGQISYSTGDENFLPLTGNSGGAVLPVINGDAHRTYNMSDPKLQQQVRLSAKVVFSMIAFFYRMQVERSQASRSEELKLDVTENLHKSSPQVLVLYPHQLGPC